jgi:hypothetical protein
MQNVEFSSRRKKTLRLRGLVEKSVAAAGASDFSPCVLR